MNVATPISRSVGGCFYVGNKYITTTFEGVRRLLLGVYKLKGESYELMGGDLEEDKSYKRKKYRICRQREK